MENLGILKPLGKGWLSTHSWSDFLKISMITPLSHLNCCWTFLTNCVRSNCRLGWLFCSLGGNAGLAILLLSTSMIGLKGISISGGIGLISSTFGNWPAYWLVWFAKLFPPIWLFWSTSGWLFSSLWCWLKDLGLCIILRGGWLAWPTLLATIDKEGLGTYLVTTRWDSVG